MTARLKRWLLLCSLLMRLLVPSGFMIDTASASTPVLVACDGEGALFGAAARSPGHHHHGPQGAASHGDCPFSPHAGPADTPAETTALGPMPRPVGVAPTLAATQHHLPAPAAPAPPSTGPPVTA